MGKQRACRGKKKNSRRSHGFHTFNILGKGFRLGGIINHEVITSKTVKTNQF